MNHLKDYYRQQAETQPEPTLTVIPAATPKPRRTLRNAGLVAASFVLTFAVITMTVPGVRAAVDEAVQKVYSIFAGTETRSYYNPATGETEEKTYPVTSVDVNDLLRKYSSNSNNTFTAHVEGELGSAGYVGGDRYDNLTEFWEAVASSGLPTVKDQSLFEGYTGNVSYSTGTQVNQWEEDGYIITEYEPDWDSVERWSISKSFGFNVIRVRYTLDTVGLAGTSFEPVTVEGWDSALVYINNVGSRTLRALKALPEEVTLNMPNGTSTYTHVECVIDSDSLTLEEMIALAEQIG